MSSSNHIHNVAIVGATGQQGQHIVSELLKTGKHTITAITRSSAGGDNKTFPAGVKVEFVDYDEPATLVQALTGQDALIITMNVTAPKDTNLKLVEAAAKAKVPWIVPDEWGLDTTNIEFGKQVILGPGKVAVREHIESLGVSSWVAVAGSFWYEYSLAHPGKCYGFDVKNREVTFFDAGVQKISTSTWEHVARTVAALLSLKVKSDGGQELSLEKDFQNRFAFVSSFTISQRDMFESLKRVTGTTDADWKITYEDSKERYDAAIKALKEGNRSGFVTAMYTRVFYPSGEGDFENAHQLVNGSLGLPQEDLDTCTKRAVDGTA